jgi:hypothetical protein
MKDFLDLTNKKFGKLTVIEYNGRGKYHNEWLCQCDCGNPNLIKVTESNLATGNTKSCGCLRIESGKKFKKYNQYNLNGEYGIGYTSKGEEFYFDLEDYDKIKEFCWGLNKDGRVIAHGNFMGLNIVQLSRLIMFAKKGDPIVDHINRNTLDNRKENLRFASDTESSQNKGLRSDNTSGVTGVSWYKHMRKWYAEIKYYGKKIRLGSYDNKEDAIAARLKAEKQYYGEFAPQRHLFEQYRIV